MPRAIRSSRLSCLGFFVLAAVGGAWAANSGSTSSDSGDDAAKKAALVEAIDACDRGAAIPLDPEAKAAPVQFGELLLSDVKKERRRELSRKCQQAALGAPQEKRLQLQWLRVQVSLDEPGLLWLIPQIKAFADSGSAEANYLLFQIFQRHRTDADTSLLVISREAGLDALQAAAQPGHLDALQMLLQQYRGGPLLRRDARKAVETAARIMSAPQQGLTPTEHDVKMRSFMPYTIAIVTLEGEGFTAEEQQKAFAVIEAKVNSASSSIGATLVYLSALRFGKGTAQDPVKARQLLEARAADDEEFVPMLADMVAKGEGGPADGKRAIAMLRDDRLKYVFTAGPVLAELLLDGKVVGRQPREAIRALLRSFDLDASIRAAGLLVDYHQQVEHEQNLVRRLNDAAAVGEPGAALALARLQLSSHPQFRDEDSARAVLKILAEQGDRTALWLYASTQYANLDSTGSRPYRRPGGLSDKDLKALVDDGVAKKEPEALLLLARLSRRGALYPQDDEAATKHLISAANLGNVEAMVLLGEAYDDGLGIDKNPRARLRAWREAARRGSLEAKAKLASAFIFDFSDRLLTLREGVTGRIALYIDGVGGTGTSIGAQFAGLFSGPRASDAGAAALAEAVMDAFREAPAGLEEQTLVDIGKALPDEIRIAVEQRLKADGFYAGEPKGYFGPEARKALAAWVDAKGPLGDIAEPPAVGELQQARGRRRHRNHRPAARPRLRTGHGRQDR